MNPLDANLTTGTVGELLVQLRFLQFGVQAAPPLKDTGNDLIAVRGREIRAIQIKTTAGEQCTFDNRQLRKKLYDGLALVQLVGEGSYLELDNCRIYLMPKEAVTKGCYGTKELNQYLLCSDVVDALFAPRCVTA
jgi:hypothetical protein